MRLPALLAALCWLLAPYPARAAEWRWSGPAQFVDAHPFSGVFLATPALDAALPAEPVWDVRWSQYSTLTISPSIFRTGVGQDLLRRYRQGLPPVRLDTASLDILARAVPEEIFLFADCETARLDLGLLYPFDERWAVALEVPIYGHFGGWHDDLVTGFHRAFNFPGLYRGLTPHDLTQLYAAQGDQSTTFEGPFSPGLGDIVVRGLHAPVAERPGQAAMAFSASLKCPTGAASRFQGSGSFDLGIACHVAKTMGDVRLYMTAGHVWHGRWDALPTVPTSNTFDLHLGGEVHFAPDWSAGLSVSRLEQALAQASPETFGRPAYSLAAGFHWRPAGLPDMGFWFFENLTEDSNTHDVGVQYAVRWAP